MVAEDAGGVGRGGVGAERVSEAAVGALELVARERLCQRPVGVAVGTGAGGDHDRWLWLEALDSEKDAAIKAERERQAAAGIHALDFGPAASKAFLDRANDVAWQSVIKRAPETGPKLRALAGN